MAQRILINAFSAKVGGGKTYITNLLLRMPPEKNLEIYIYLPDNMSLPEDARIKRLHTSWPTNNPILRSLWEQFQLPRVLKALKVEMLFCPGGVYSTRPSKKFKIVTMFRNMLPFDPRILSSSDSVFEKVRGYLRKRLMLRSMTSAHAVIFISSFARKIIESQATIQKAVTIPHGISKQFYVLDETLDRPHLPFEGRYLLYVSRFEFYKRHLEVVKAYEKLPQQIKNEYKLLLVGGTDLPTGNQVKQYIHSQNLGSDIVLLGDYPYQQLPSLYKNASLILFASTCENCPNILLESMGAGVPILCSNYDPMPEFGGQAVSYMNPDNPDDIAQAIQNSLKTTLSNSKELLRRQADLFSWDQTAKKTWEFLLSL
jgi:glycosyltransferase involved in cell wall biosynthesis